MRTATRRATVYGGKLIPWYTAGGAPTPIAAYQPKGAASLAASYINLANPGTYDAAAGTAPTFDTATGWTFNGSTQYLTTGIIPTGGNWSLIIQFSDATTAGLYALAGAADGPGSELAIFPALLSAVYYSHGGSGIGVAPTLTTGTLAVAGRNGYRNGVLDTSSVPAWTASNARELIIGGENISGTPSRFISATIAALSIYDSVLSAGQVAAISAAMAAL